MDDQLEKVKRLYELALASTSSPRPKRGFLSSKCPLCGTKLKKEKIVHPLYAGEGADPFANKVLHDHGASPGVYSLTLNHFTCSCSYVHTEQQLDEVESES